MKENEVFAQYWYTKGKDETDLTNRFFCFFVSFNALYNQYKCGNEPARIMQLVAICFLRKDFNDLSLKIAQNGELYKTKVKDMRNGQNSSLYDLEELRANNPISIFMAIYQVRCNLFHGSKKDLARDKELIKESSVLLESFLKKYFEVVAL